MFFEKPKDKIKEFKKEYKPLAKQKGNTYFQKRKLSKLFSIQK